jgi:CheY-like chemotaxis protein
VSDRPRDDRQPVYLPSIITSAVEGVRHVADARKIAIAVDAEGGTVMADPDQLRETLATALAHALRHTKNGGGIGISATRDDVQAEVRVVTELVTVFSLQFPLLPFGLPATQRTAAGRTPHRECSGLRVLVVDDEADGRTLVAEVLTRHGATVDVAASALLALVALGRNRYDVLVTDLTMPLDDGFNFLEQVRREPTPNMTLPAVALTGDADPETRERALAAGFAAYVTKPVSADALVRVVAAVGKG